MERDSEVASDTELPDPGSPVAEYSVVDRRVIDDGPGTSTGHEMEQRVILPLNDTIEYLPNKTLKQISDKRRLLNSNAETVEAIDLIEEDEVEQSDDQMDNLSSDEIMTQQSNDENELLWMELLKECIKTCSPPENGELKAIDEKIKIIACRDNDENEQETYDEIEEIIKLLTNILKHQQDEELDKDDEGNDIVIIMALPPVEDIENFYSELWGVIGSEEGIPKLCDLERTPSIPIERIIYPITAEEVINKLKNIKSNTAPGVDGIRKMHLRMKGAVQVIANLYNLLLIKQYFPEEWKVNRTVLIPKPNKNPKDVKNWRPLTIGSLINRIFSSMIDNRLRPRIEQSIRQKGFTKEDGCKQNVALLRASIAHMKQDKGGIVTVVDIAKAFNTIPHSAIEDCLIIKGVPERIAKVIKKAFIHKLVIIHPPTKTLKNIVNALRQVIKKILHLHPSTTDGIIYNSKCHGGLGVQKIENIVKLAVLRNILKMKESKDISVREVAANMDGTGLKYARSINLTWPTTMKEIDDARIKLKKAETDRWQQLISQGQGVADYRGDKIGNSWLYNPNLLKPSRYLDALKLRSNTFGTRVVLRRADKQQSLNCRRCNMQYETLGHVLGNCIHTKAARIQRHDEIKNFIANKIANKYTVFVEPTVNVIVELKKPDLVIKDQERLIIVDITVRYEDKNNLRLAYEEKINKYKETAEYIKLKLNCSEAKILPIVVGSRGVIPRDTLTNAKAIGLTKNDLLTVSMIALHSSIEIANAFIDYDIIR
ncbi:uncharacterized protein LOC143266308 [Megachile rotundata]|uniref:uncharacterized protein LOC143266308 n=1 Tax=Megachile rotundata TaxID=143995 RepID=UPI003FD6A694